MNSSLVAQDINLIDLNEDFFNQMMESNICKVTTVVTWVLVQLIGTPALAGIVRFKAYGSLNYQTLLDKLVMYFYTLLLLNNMTSFNVILVRTFTALPRCICIVHIVILNGVVAGCCITGLEVQLLRYFYLCVWKNVGMLDDDMFGRFFITFNTCLIICVMLMITLTREYLGFDLAMCDGSETETFYKMLNESKKIRTMPILLLVTCIIPMVSSILVSLHKKREQFPVPEENISTLFDMGSKGELCMVSVLIVAILPGTYVRWLYNNGQLNSVTPGLYSWSLSHLYLTVFFLWPLAMYYHNGALRKHAMKKLKQKGFLPTCLVSTQVVPII